MIRLVIAISAVAAAQPAFVAERLSATRDRVCATRKLPAIERIAEVRGVIAAAKDGERCAAIERSATADRDEVIRCIGDLIIEEDNR